MTPEIESLAQQLIEAAKKTTPRKWKSDGDDVDPEADDPYIYVDVEGTRNGVSVLFNSDWGTTEDAAYVALAQPANITAVIRAFREELKQARRDALEEAAKLADKLQDAAGDVLEKSHNDDAAAQYDTAMEIAEAIRDLKEPEVCDE